MVNVPLWFQAAWTNSKTKGLELTNAVALRVPIQPPATQQRRALWAFSASATASVLAPSNRASDLPVILYSGQLGLRYAAKSGSGPRAKQGLRRAAWPRCCPCHWQASELLEVSEGVEYLQAHLSVTLVGLRTFWP